MTNASAPRRTAPAKALTSALTGGVMAKAVASVVEGAVRHALSALSGTAWVQHVSAPSSRRVTLVVTIAVNPGTAADVAKELERLVDRTGPKRGGA